MRTCLILFFIFAKFGSIVNVEIEFRVNKVPKYYTPLNDKIYLANSYNGWSPNSQIYVLNRLSFDTFSITLDLPVGIFEYKFTRGSWDTAETLLNGNQKPNRVLNIITTNKQIVNIEIENWEDMKGRHTASGDVYILDRNFPYPQFSRTKRIWIYLPNDYKTLTNKRYPVIYMHDGQNVFDDLYSFAGEWGVDETLEEFSSQSQPIQSSIVVAIETKGVGVDGERLEELTPFKNNTYGGGKGDLYLDFIINDLKPYVDRNFRTLPDRDNTGMIGSSLGGLFSFYTSLKYQDIFSKVGVFSPSFWFSDEVFTFASRYTQKYDNFKMYFVCGYLENPNMPLNMIKMINQIKTQGFNHISYTIEQDGTHSEWFWNREFKKAYKWLFN